MNRDQRLEAILDLLSGRERVLIEDLVRDLGISAATARRDLDALAARRLVHRTRGGASAHTISYDLPLRYQRAPNAAAKEQIARAAVELVRPGDRIGLTGGSTCTAIASALGRLDLPTENAGRPAEQPVLTVVTNAVNIAAHLLIRPRIRVVMTGGVVHPRSYELTGPYSDLMLAQVNLDLAFIGVNALDPAGGAMVHDDAEAQVNRLMAQRASAAWVVADGEKIGGRAFATIGTGADFAGLITDPGVDRTTRAALTEAGWRLHGT